MGKNRQKTLLSVRNRKNEHHHWVLASFKRASFERLVNLFLCFIYLSLVISSTEQQHTIISDVHKGLGHDKAMAKAMGKVMALHCGKGFNDTKDFK